jgi:hypothetical protein
VTRKKPSKRQVLEVVSAKLLDSALQELAQRDLSSINFDFEELRPVLQSFLRELRDFALSGASYPDMRLYGAIGELIVPKLLEGIDRRTLTNPREILATPLARAMLRAESKQQSRVERLI